VPIQPVRLTCILLLLSVALIVSGCSELIPGLRVRDVGNGEHQYKIVTDQQHGGYTVAKAAPIPSYQVIPVGPEVLKSLAHEQQDGFSYNLPMVLPSDVPPEYKIGSGDILYVTVWDHPELSVPAAPTSDVSASIGSQSQAQFVQGRLVASDGTVFFPYVGVFKIAGMTAADSRQYLATHLQGVITNPQVDVRVLGYRSARVEVTGEVAKPGTINLDDTPKGIIQAINQSGGLTTTASRRRAILVRGGKTYQLDLAGLLSGDRPVGNPMLLPGDVLHIPDQSGDQVFVLGGVDKQQPVPIQQASMTLIQALTTAGGVNFSSGKQTGVLIFRMRQYGTEKPEAQVFTIDLANPQGILMASEFDLHARDVVYVPTTAFSQYNSIISQLLPTVTTIFEVNQLTKAL